MNQLTRLFKRTPKPVPRVWILRDPAKVRRAWELFDAADTQVAKYDLWKFLTDELGVPAGTSVSMDTSSILTITVREVFK